MPLNHRTRPVSRPLREGLRVLPAGFPLIGLRWSLQLLCALPALVAAQRWASRYGELPYYADIGRLPAIHLLRLSGSLSALGASVIGSAACWLFVDQLLTAGAVTWLAQPQAQRCNKLWQIIKEGFSGVWVVLRVLCLAAGLAAAGAWLLGYLFGQLKLYGERQAWNGQSLLLTLPAARGSLLVLYLAVVGTFSHWLKVIALGECGGSVRKALRYLYRHRRPRGALGLFVLASLISLVAPSLFLWSWRQSAPRDWSLYLWVAGWFTATWSLGYVWHWKVHAAVRCFVRQGQDTGNIESQ